MIKKDKTIIPVPQILLDNNTSGTGEKQRTIDYYEHGIGRKVEYSIYKRDEVRDALNSIFLGKCAYCESKVSHVSTSHIEHWRPKGGVTGQRDHKGYYWLASDWDNLLLACPLCNNAPYKGNHFPLKSGIYAVRSSDDYKSIEQPALINPCETDPKYHLTFEDGGFIIGTSVEGNRSIKIYGLDRTSLTVEREKYEGIIRGYLEDIVNNIDDAKEATERIKNDLDDTQNVAKILQATDKYRRRIKNKIKDLRKFIKPESEFLAMKIKLLQDYEEEYSDNEFMLSIMRLIRK